MKKELTNDNQVHVVLSLLPVRHLLLDVEFGLLRLQRLHSCLLNVLWLPLSVTRRKKQQQRESVRELVDVVRWRITHKFPLERPALSWERAGEASRFTGDAVDFTMGVLENRSVSLFMRAFWTTSSGDGVLKPNEVTTPLPSTAKFNRLREREERTALDPTISHMWAQTRLQASVASSSICSS